MLDTVRNYFREGTVVTTQLVIPAIGIILGAEDGGRHLTPCFYQFQYISSLRLLEGVKQPLVQDEQLLFLELFHIVPVCSAGPGHGDLHQQIRQTDVTDGVKVTISCHAKSAGQIGLTYPGWTQDDDII